MQPPQAGRRPPVPLAEQRHQARHEQGADDRRVDHDGEAGPHPELLDEDDVGRGERAYRHAEEQRCGGHDPAGALEPEGHRLRVRQPRVVVLLDPRQQEDPVVGRERERDHEQQDRLRRLEGALARVAQEPLERAARPGRSARAGRRRR